MKRLYKNNKKLLIITTKNFIIRSNYSKIEGAYIAYIELKSLDEILSFGSGKNINTAVFDAIHNTRKIKKMLNNLLK
ncbi:MAG: hypothetical protein KAQ98_11830 [Bacteriovoracaceae bacterium]|nr:hypothetical protein [Bacteriovoracaceae bacterium]